MPDAPSTFIPDSPATFVADPDQESAISSAIKSPLDLTNRLIRTLSAGAEGAEMGRQEDAETIPQDPLAVQRYVAGGGPMAGMAMLPPAPDIPRVEGGEGTLGQIGAAGINTASSLYNAAKSPAGVTLAALAPVSPLLGAAAGVGFGLPAIYGGLKKVYEYGGGLNNLQEGLEGAGEVGLGALMTAGGIKGFRSPVTEPVPETFVPDKPPIIAPPKISEVQPRATEPATAEAPPEIVPQPKLVENKPSETPAVTKVAEEPAPPAVEQSVTPPVTDPIVTPSGPQMGAAGVEELTDTGTGLKNAIGELERVGLGLRDAPETVQRNMANAWQESGQREAQTPGTGANIAAMLARDPDMGLSDVESALLLRHKEDLWNRMNDAAERTHTGDAASRAAAQAEHDKLIVDFGNLLDAVKKRGTEWGREGRWRQAMVKEDFTFSTTDDLNRYHRSLTGEDLPAKKVAEAGKKAKTVKDAQDAADKATNEVQNDLDKKAPPPRVVDAVKAALDAAHQRVREAAIMVANAESRSRVARTVEERKVATIQEQAAKKALKAAETVAKRAAEDAAKESARAPKDVKLDEQAKAAKAALDAAAKVVRDNAKQLADLENRARTAKGAADRTQARVQAKAAKRALDAADQFHRKAAIDLAKAQRALRADPIKAVWSKVRERLDTGEGDFDEIRNRVAIDLGMKPDQVARIMAQDQRTKMLMDDAWLKQQKAAQLRQEAKRWVAGVETPEGVKILQNIPRAAFGIKTFGHGTVPLGTHAPFVAFQPKFWAKYFPAYKTMYKMVVNKAFYEQQVQDLQRRPNYVAAKRGGLVNDPNVYEDYTSPEISKYIGGSQVGVRGFTVLKILRQDMFDQMWNKLRKSEQTDEMATSISDAVNHDTGVVRAMAPKGFGTALFAPRLEASRVASLVADPAKAIGIFTKQLWTKATPAERQFAVHQLTSKASIGATLYGLLLANQGILSSVGSGQKVNLDDPFRSDWMKFKVAGMDFAYGNAMLSMMRMPASIYRIISSDGGKTKNLVYEDESIATVLFRYGRTQLSPFAGTVLDQALGSDYASRPLPRKMFGLIEQDRPVPKRLAAQGLEEYTYPEYWSEQVSPIPLQEAMKSIWRHGFGMNDEQVDALEKAVAISTIMGLTGGRLTEDTDITK